MENMILTEVGRKMGLGNERKERGLGGGNRGSLSRRSLSRRARREGRGRGKGERKGREGGGGGREGDEEDRERRDEMAVVFARRVSESDNYCFLMVDI